MGKPTRADLAPAHTEPTYRMAIQTKPSAELELQPISETHLRNPVENFPKLLGKLRPPKKKI